MYLHDAVNLRSVISNTSPIRIDIPNIFILLKIEYVFLYYMSLKIRRECNYQIHIKTIKDFYIKVDYFNKSFIIITFPLNDIRTDDVILALLNKVYEITNKPLYMLDRKGKRIDINTN